MKEQSVFSWLSPQAAEVTRLFIGVLIVSAVIFLLVTILVTITCVRFKARGDETPPQRHGRVGPEIVWTVAPFLLLVIIFFFTVRVIRSAEPDSDRALNPDIVVIGHQWWWEVRYPRSGVVTANEIHIPAGKQWLARVESADVIHDFWVPALGPKIDAVPGHPNYLWLSSDSPGIFVGACAEYCGNQHAWMRIRVIAQQADAFTEWEARENRPADVTEDSAGLRLFRQHTCINCHALKGTRAAATVGPDLTHIASRETIGAGVVANTDFNLRQWLSDPQAVKPGILMPNFRMSPGDVDMLVQLLESLR